MVLKSMYAGANRAAINPSALTIAAIMIQLRNDAPPCFDFIEVSPGCRDSSISIHPERAWTAGATRDEELYGNAAASCNAAPLSQPRSLPARLSRKMYRNR